MTKEDIIIDMIKKLKRDRIADKKEMLGAISENKKNMTPEENVYNYLQKLEIKYSIFEHEAFFTCEASGSFYAENSAGADCKTLFLRNRKGKKYFMIVLLSHKKLDIKEFAKSIEEHPKMSFASPERLLKKLGVTAGSVTPFGLLHENSTDVNVFIDSEIFESDDVHFHPLRNTATVKLSTDNFKKYLDSLPQFQLENISIISF